MPSCTEILRAVLATTAAAIAVAAVAGCRTAGEIRVTVRDSSGVRVTVERTRADQAADKTVRDLADVAGSVAASPAGAAGPASIENAADVADVAEPAAEPEAEPPASEPEPEPDAEPGE